MDTITKSLLIICIVLVIFIIIILILYFKNTPEEYASKLKKRNKVDEEIEKELRNNK